MNLFSIFIKNILPLHTRDRQKWCLNLGSNALTVYLMLGKVREFDERLEIKVWKSYHEDYLWEIVTYFIE